jgi:uncharacterized protein DUF4386
MKNLATEISPQHYARIGGMAYLIIIIAGLSGEMFIRNPVIVSGNATATAAHIAASEQLWRIGIAGDLLMHICDVVLMVVLYVLLRPVNKNLALMAVLFNLVQTAVLVANKMNLLMPLFLVGGDEYLKAFSADQLQAMSYLFVKAHSYGFGIGLIYFGCECMIVGYLIYRSGYLPKLIGILMVIAGLSYLCNTAILILAPKYTGMAFPILLALAFPAELSLCLWLLIKGVDLEKWTLKTTAV